MKIDPQDPRVIWRRAYRVGEFRTLTGPVTITPEMLDGSLEGFKRAQAAGVLPSVVYDHAEGTQRLGLGHIVGLEKRPDGWAWAGFYFEPPADHVEYADFTSRTEAAFRAGTIADVSIEARFNVVNPAYYGDWICPMEINAIAVLPPGDFPAIPGAGKTAAGTAQKSIAFRVSMGETADAEKAEERIVEEKLAALASRVEVVEKGIEECKAGIGKLVKAGEDRAKAEADAAAAAAKAKADAENDGTLKAARAKLDNRMVAGTAEKVDASLKTLDSPAAKLAVLATLDAMLPAKLAAGDDEKLNGKAPDGGKPSDTADPAGEYVKTVMARDKTPFASALVTACNEKPELFAAPKA